MKTNILLVDDNKDACEAMKLALSSDESFQYYFACSGVDALNLVKKCSPALILLDIKMKGMDGMEVLSKLKADPKTRHIPVLIISAKEEPEVISKALNGGAAGYMKKPFSPSDLRQQAWMLLGR